MFRFSISLDKILDNLDVSILDKILDVSILDKKLGEGENLPEHKLLTRRTKHVETSKYFSVFFHGLSYKRFLHNDPFSNSKKPNFRLMPC
jgi:hypothetical protein